MSESPHRQLSPTHTPRLEKEGVVSHKSVPSKWSEHGPKVRGLLSPESDDELLNDHESSTIVFRQKQRARINSDFHTSLVHLRDNLLTAGENAIHPSFHHSSVVS